MQKFPTTHRLRREMHMCLLPSFRSLRPTLNRIYNRALLIVRFTYSEMEFIHVCSLLIIVSAWSRITSSCDIGIALTPRHWQRNRAQSRILNRVFFAAGGSEKEVCGRIIQRERWKWRCVNSAGIKGREYGAWSLSPLSMYKMTKLNRKTILGF